MQCSHPTEIVVSKHDSFAQHWCPNDLRHLIPTQKQTKLIIEDADIMMQKSSTSLLHAQNNNPLESDLSLSKKIQMRYSALCHNTAKVSVLYKCKIDDIQNLMSLCPRMEFLQIRVNDRIEAIVEYIAKNPCKSQCFSICFQDGDSITVQKLQKIIASKQLLNDYTIGRFGDKVYLWW